MTGASGCAPSLAVYYGYLDEDPRSDRLAYAWCQDDCHAPSGWSVYELGLPKEYGHDVDLALDAQGRPHLAYQIRCSGPPSIHGLGYARCTDGCETSSPHWQAGLVETAEGLDAAEPVPPGTEGYSSHWLYVGGHPSLVMDAAGTARIGCDCEHSRGTWWTVSSWTSGSCAWPPWAMVMMTMAVPPRPPIGLSVCTCPR